MPDEIISKPGKLNEHEWAIIRTHTVEGQKMLERIGGFMRDIGRIVRASHERWDGCGYPDGLSGEAIPLESRIVAACDAFNAMTTTRSYRKAMGAPAAVAELLRCSGTQFDPQVVDALVRISTRVRQAADRKTGDCEGDSPIAAPAADAASVVDPAVSLLPRLEAEQPALRLASYARLDGAGERA